MKSRFPIQMKPNGCPHCLLEAMKETAKLRKTSVVVQPSKVYPHWNELRFGNCKRAVFTYDTRDVTLDLCTCPEQVAPQPNLFTGTNSREARRQEHDTIIQEVTGHSGLNY